MGKVELNLAYDSVKGKESEYKYIRRNGRVYIALRRPPTASQEAAQAAFHLAAGFHRRVLADPALLAEYEALAAREMKPLRTVTMTDYFRRPKVTAIELGRFNGTPGSLIQVVAFKDGGTVTSVQVTLRAEDDSLLEEGAAAMLPEGWVYTTTGTYPPGTPISITATAVDRFGHQASKLGVWS